MLRVTNRLKRYAAKHWQITDGDAAKIRNRVATELTKSPKFKDRLKRLTDATPPKKKANDPPKPDPNKGFGHDDKDFKHVTPFFKSLSDIHVKGIDERFNKERKPCYYPLRNEKTGMAHPQAGKPIMLSGKHLTHPSEFDLAVVGAFWKMACNAIYTRNNMPVPAWAEPRDPSRKNLHDQLLNYAMKQSEWTGIIGPDEHGNGGVPINRGKLTGENVKTLIADTTSGGLYAVPQAFDDAIVLYPILYGELAPHVTIKDVRSNRVQGALMNRPRITSGVVEGTTVQPFDTAAFIQAFDTGVYNAQGSMEIGKDFEDDSPAAIGQTVVEMFGQEAMAWMDRVIAYGNGVTEPLGVLRTQGATAVSSANGAGGPLTVSDFMALQFGINKALRTEPGYRSFISNDTGYRNSRNIQVGPNDERRIFGMDVQSYQIMNDPYAVQNDIPDGLFGYANLTRFRLYRRQGTQITMDDSGYTLRQRNTRLIVVRMRYGGRLDYAGAVAVMTDGQQQ